jgi:hypothetical protein
MRRKSLLLTSGLIGAQSAQKQMMAKNTFWFGKSTLADFSELLHQHLVM